MNPHSHLSSYLVKRRPLAPLRRQRAGRLHNRLIVLTSLAPHMSRRSRAAALAWVLLLGLGVTGAHHRPAGQTSDLAGAAGAVLLGSLPAAAASAAPVLPGGPSGHVLPPGTMAPRGTYANSYARGQCTWYVAGRRPIPANWGHARSWYAAARRAGWSTGTTPAVAAIAWTNSGWYGHVALVEAVDAANGRVLISEMNYYGPYRYSTRWVPAGSFKYIY